MNHNLELVSGKRSCLRPCLPLFLLTLASLLLPSTAWAQVSYTGSAANQNFGSQAIGSTSAAKTFNFSVAAGTTVGSIGVVTQGAPNLDFVNATGSTCAAQTYATATTCTVNVAFTPKAAGLRKGAVVFFSGASNTGTALGMAPVYGVGTGPQVAYGPAPAVQVNVGVTDPFGLAVDAAGDLFIADNNVDDRIDEVPAGGGAAIAIYPTVNGSGLNGPNDITVDGAGDLFVVDSYNERVVEVAIGGVATAISPTVDGKALSFVGGCGYGGGGVAVDGAGDLFIADTNNRRVLEVPAGGGAPIAVDISVNGNGVYGPCRLAIDGAGNLFIADITHVVKAPAGGGPGTAIYAEVNGSPLSAVFAVALDGAGDLFIGDAGRVVEVPAGGGAAIAIDPVFQDNGLEEIEGLAVDGLGNLFISNFFYSEVVEVQRSQPPVLNFPTVTAVGSIDTTDGTMTAQIVNVGNEPLALTALSYPADFSEASGDTKACTGSTSLSAGQECDLPIEFAPLHGGALSEDVTLTDNALNAASPEYAQQSIALTGTSTQQLNSIVITPSSSFATLPGGSQQFTATGSYSGGSTQNLTSQVSWSSSKTTAVTIGGFGLATWMA